VAAQPPALEEGIMVRNKQVAAVETLRAWKILAIEKQEERILINDIRKEAKEKRKSL
jgi:hypothetical protein